AKSLQQQPIRAQEWLGKQPAVPGELAGGILVRNAVGVGTATIHRTIEHTDIVGQHALAEVAAELDAEIPIRQQIRGQPGLDEAPELFELQTLQADWSLEFAELKDQPRLHARVSPGVLQDGFPLREVRHDTKVKIARQRSLQRRP